MMKYILPLLLLCGCKDMKLTPHGFYKDDWTYRSVNFQVFVCDFEKYHLGGCQQVYEDDPWYQKAKENSIERQRKMNLRELKQFGRRHRR